MVVVSVVNGRVVVDGRLVIGGRLVVDDWPIVDDRLVVDWLVDNPVVIADGCLDVELVVDADECLVEEGC